MEKPVDDEEFYRKSEKLSIAFLFVSGAVLALLGLFVLHPILTRRRRLRMRYLHTLPLSSKSRIPSLLDIDRRKPHICHRLYGLTFRAADAEGHVYTWLPPAQIVYQEQVGGDEVSHVQTCSGITGPSTFEKPIYAETINEEHSGTTKTATMSAAIFGDNKYIPLYSQQSVSSAPLSDAAGFYKCVSSSNATAYQEANAIVMLPDHLPQHAYRAQAMNIVNDLLPYFAQFGGQKHWREYVWEPMDDVDDFLLDRHHLLPYSSIPIDLMTKLSLLYQDARYGELCVSRQQCNDIKQIIHAVCLCLQKAAFGVLEAAVAGVEPQVQEADLCRVSVCSRESQRNTGMKQIMSNIKTHAVTPIAVTMSKMYQQRKRLFHTPTSRTDREERPEASANIVVHAQSHAIFRANFFLPESLACSLVDHNPMLKIHPLPVRPKNSRFGTKGLARRRTKGEKLRLIMREKRLLQSVGRTFRHSKNLVIATATTAANNITHALDIVATTASATTRMVAHRLSVAVGGDAEAESSVSGDMRREMHDPAVSVSVTSVSDDDSDDDDDAGASRNLISKPTAAANALSMHHERRASERSGRNVDRVVS